MSMMEWAKREVEIASKRERGDNRYFKEGEKSFIEISPEEYEERKKMHEKRQEQEAKAQDEN